MSRRKRLVLPGIPHHVTQRGVRRRAVFRKPQDYKIYLDLLRQYADRYGCLVVAYCLMTNHVHHLLVPLAHDSLRWTFQLTHRRYAEYFNATNGWTGHAWQEKFYSAPVDEEFFWITLRYIERNPVEAAIVQEATQYEWSSAAFHCGLRIDPIINLDNEWHHRKQSIANWKSWLAYRDSPQRLEQLRKSTARDLPVGSEAFLGEIERSTGQKARLAQMGRPKKKVA